jgi:hypothetical protein
VFGYQERIAGLSLQKIKRLKIKRLKCGSVLFF